MKEKSLEFNLQLEKANSAIKDESCEKALAFEKKLLQDARDQLKSSITNANENLEIANKRLHEKEAEIETLNDRIKELNQLLNSARDEILQLKSQMSSNMSAMWHHSTETRTTSQASEIPDDTNMKPTALLIGTSNIEGIKEDKISDIANFTKMIKYTMRETKSAVSEIVSAPPSVIILHSLTNDLKGKRPQICADEMFDLTTSICSKWPLVKIIISLTTPRSDSVTNNTNGQIINLLLKQKFTGVDNIFLVEHSNMLYQGNPKRDLLCADGYHLNEKGISHLAGNLKRAIHTVLEEPLPTNTRRPRSRSRRPNRGRNQ